MIKKPAPLLLSLPVATAGLSAKESHPHSNQVAQVQPGKPLTPGAILAAQVGEIAATKDLSERSKNRQIANAARLAVSTSTTNLKSQDKALALVLDLVTQAAKAAPDFSEVINQASFEAAQALPLLENIPDLKAQVQDAVFAGVKAAAEQSGEAHFESERSHGGNRGGGDDNGGGHEFGGHDGDVIVSPSQPKQNPQNG